METVFVHNILSKLIMQILLFFINTAFQARAEDFQIGVALKIPRAKRAKHAKNFLAPHLFFGLRLFWLFYLLFYGYFLWR